LREYVDRKKLMNIGRRVEKADKKTVGSEHRVGMEEVVLKEKGKVEVFERVVVRLGRLRFRQSWLEREVSGSLTLAVMGICVLVGVLVGVGGGWVARGGEGGSVGDLGSVMEGARNWSEHWQYGDQIQKGLGWSMERDDIFVGIPSVVI
jgi:hypothetical protein